MWCLVNALSLRIRAFIPKRFPVLYLWWSLRICSGFSFPPSPALIRGWDLVFSPLCVIPHSFHHWAAFKGCAFLSLASTLLIWFSVGTALFLCVCDRSSPLVTAALDSRLPLFTGCLSAPFATRLLCEYLVFIAFYWKYKSDAL